MSVDVATEIVRERSLPVRAIRDAFAVTWRNLIAYRRVPRAARLLDDPAGVFVVMFRFVFGGAIAVPVRGLPLVNF